VGSIESGVHVGCPTSADVACGGGETASPELSIRKIEPVSTAQME